MLPAITSIRPGSACWIGSPPRAWRCSRKRSNKRTGGDIATSSCAIVSFNRAREPGHQSPGDRLAKRPSGEVKRALGKALWRQEQASEETATDKTLTVTGRVTQDSGASIGGLL